VLLARAKRKFWSPATVRLTALVGVLLFGWVNLLAISDQCHTLVHGPEATSDHHQCAATLLAQGKLLDNCSTLSVHQPASLPLFETVTEFVPWLSCKYCFSPSRAPPPLRT
jgi:hypothetical protein